MNATIPKFGYPATLIRDYGHWVVLLRPSQPTLGSLVVAAKHDATAFSALPAEAFAELQTVVAEVEAALAAAVRHERINWLMLMMVDPHVHFHVLPRYDGERRWGELTVADAGWPKLPDLATAATLEEAAIAAMRDWLKGYFPA